MRKRPRPHATTRIGDRMKLHRRQVWLAGREYTVITLRPGTDARFSTNYFHDTWHVLSDWHGTKLLGRLLWGLAYQRRAGTLVLIDRPLLDPNPFDAERADPIALVAAQLTPLTGKAARELRRRLPLAGPSHGTVRWLTHGLDVAVTSARHEPPGGSSWPPDVRPRGFQGRVDRTGGLLTIAGTPSTLRDWAVQVFTLSDYAYYGMAYVDLAGPLCFADGEVQIFRDYRRRVGTAQVARREVLAEQPTPLGPSQLNPLIWDRTGLMSRAR